MGSESRKTAAELLDMYFLNMRSALLETAAALDRIQRGPGAPEALNDPRLRKLRAACDILKEPDPGRAERFLLLFSEPEQ